MEEFYLKPENATELSEKKYVSTKTKTQKKILDKSLKSLYEEFMENEESDFYMSFSTFCKLRPANVKLMTNRMFNQCLCEYCCNIELKIQQINQIARNRLFKFHNDDKYAAARLSLCNKQSSEWYQNECLKRNCNNCGIILHIFGSYCSSDFSTIKNI